MLKLLCRTGLLLAGLSFSAQASLPYGPTQIEAKSLPGYCQGSPEWNALLGPDAGWNNHTCYGINWLNRYYRARNPGDRKLALQTALGDFNYSIAKLKPDFLLMPEIYMYRGITYSLSAQHGAAVVDLLKAIGMNPKLVRAYNELADIYDGKYSKPAKALEVVSDGMRHNPETKSLQRRYTQLGGKLPFPAPVVKTEPAEPASAGVKPETTPVPGTPAAAMESAPSTAAPSDAAKQDGTPKIGAPSNPFCRFCPP